MSYGPVKVFSGSIASGASTLTSIDVSKSWSRVYVELPTMSTAAELAVYGSSDGTTFRPVFERVATSSVQYQALVVASGVGANGGVAELAAPLQYLQFRASAVVSGGVALKLVCID
jgi:hypothetical protein